MTLKVSHWPFLPEEQRTPEQNERWWAECYHSSPVDVTLRGVAGSVIIYGGPGSGKSVALKALARVETEYQLLIHYPLDRWPGQPQVMVADYNHLGQMMAGAALEIKTFLAQQPDLTNRLSPVNLEYLRWLIEKHSGTRAFRRWADALNQPALLDLLAQPFDDIYPTDTHLSDVQGQIEELVTLSRRLGFRGVVVLVDVHETEMGDEVILEKMGTLFGWLTPWQYEGFAIKAALPIRAVEQANLIERARGRINFALLLWSEEACRELCRRHLQAATDGRLTSLLDIVSEELLVSLEDQLKALYVQPLPLAWVRLTALLLEYYTKSYQRIAETEYETLLCAYFARYIPLKFDRKRRGVWRGQQWIALDDGPFSFLETLWRYRHSEDTNRALMATAGSQGYLNTLASRLRKRIEPVPGQPVYILNSRSQGYWLENVMEV